MRRRTIITLLITSNVILLMLLFLPARPDANDLRDSYRGIAIGDPESKLLQMIDSPDLFLVGVAEQTTDGPTWTLDWVQDGPIKSLLTADDLKKNAFWEQLGWTYPVHPLTGRVMVIGERSFSSNYIYAYIDASQKVAAIYVGGS